MRHPRIAFAALTLSAAGLAGLVLEEGYTDQAVIPTKGDRPTVGFGSTFREDGTPVQMGDTTTPPKAIARTVAHIAKDESGLQRCVTGAMSQVEYDILLKFSYQYGVHRTCNSSMVRNINAGNYRLACENYTLYRTSAGFDCSIPGNRVCAGVWTRNLERRDQCLAAQ